MTESSGTQRPLAARQTLFSDIANDFGERDDGYFTP
jgi:hypothetical protein